MKSMGMITRQTALFPISIAVVLMPLGLACIMADAPKFSHLFPAGAQRGTTTTVACGGDSPWPVKVWSSAGTATASDTKGQLEISIPQDFVGDRIWLRLYNEHGTTSPFPFLVGNLPEVSEVEPNDSPEKAQQLSKTESGDCTTTINGVLQKNGDVDSFAVDLSDGQTLVAAVAANTAFGSPMDAILQIVSPTGIVLAENHDDVGLDPRLAYRCKKPGIHVVRIFAFPSAPNQQIRFHGGAQYVYRMTLTTGPYITHAIPSAVHLEPTSAYLSRSVKPFGWNIPTDSQLPVLQFARSSADQPIEFVASEFALRTGSQVGIVNATNYAGSSRILLVSHNVESLAGDQTPDQPKLLQAPVTVCGSIRKERDIDCFRVPMTKGTAYQIAVESVSLHSAMVPMARLKDPTGKVVAEVRENSNASDAVLSHTAGLDGEYTLTIRDRYHHGGERYFYRLSIVPRPCDFALSLAADSYRATPTEPAEIQVSVVRHTGSGETISDIEIEAVGLPPGATAASVISKSEGDTSGKVTLTVKTVGTSFSGPIQIRGTAVGRKIIRTAMTQEKFQSRFNAVWMTIQPGEK